MGDNERLCAAKPHLHVWLKRAPRQSGSNLDCWISSQAPKLMNYQGFLLVRSIYRGCLLFEVNTKYISLSLMKISVNTRVHSTSEISDIFNNIY